MSVLTNDSVGRISDELKNLIDMAHDCGAVVVLSNEEASKHNVEESGSVVFSDDLTADLCSVLGWFGVVVVCTWVYCVFILFGVLS